MTSMSKRKNVLWYAIVLLGLLNPIAQTASDDMTTLITTSSIGSGVNEFLGPAFSMKECVESYFVFLESLLHNNHFPELRNDNDASWPARAWQQYRQMAGRFDLVKLSDNIDRRVFYPICAQRLVENDEKYGVEAMDRFGANAFSLYQKYDKSFGRCASLDTYMRVNEHRFFDENRERAGPDMETDAKLMTDFYPSMFHKKAPERPEVLERVRSHWQRRCQRWDEFFEMQQREEERRHKRIQEMEEERAARRVTFQIGQQVRITSDYDLYEQSYRAVDLIPMLWEERSQGGNAVYEIEEIMISGKSTIVRFKGVGWWVPAEAVVPGPVVENSV